MQHRHIYVQVRPVKLINAGQIKKTNRQLKDMDEDDMKIYEYQR